MGTTLEDLKEMRDQIRIKLHLAGMDAKKQWQQLEPKLAELEQKVGKATGAVVEELAGAFRKLRDDLMDEPGYGFTATLEDVSFEEARERITETLAAEGFGVLTEIDVKATLKKKLDVDVPPYVILGACNPKLAHRALEVEPALGLLLPCNVVVRENEAGGTDVMVIDPQAMFKVVTNPAVSEIADEAEQRLRRALDEAAGK